MAVIPLSVSPACGARAEVKVIDEPVTVYSEAATRMPLRYKRRLATGFALMPR